MKRGLSVGAFLLLGATAALQWHRLPGHVSGWYGVAVFTLLAAKLAFSLTRGPYRITERQQRIVDGLDVAVLITMFNEDPEALRACLESLLRQTRKPSSVTVIDDGSEDPRGVLTAHEMRLFFLDRGIDFSVIEQPVNMGKREALAVGVHQHPTADVYLGVDSDTLLHEDALMEGLKPFADPSVNGVTGQVLAWNHRTNLLTRLIDLRYANAFLFERAAYSLLGSVLCICGSLGFYRGTVVRENLEDFLGQTFLGRKCTYGDDRRLTNYCLMTGKVVMQSSAVAWTLVPERFGHYVKQQVRWNKSFFRESLWVICNQSMAKPSFWLTFVEMASWITFTIGLMSSLVVAPFRAGIGILPIWLLFAMLLSYARSARYLEAGHERMPVWERVGTYLIAPLYGFLHVGVLLWLRMYALATLRDTRWGTREKGVEVAVGRQQPVDVLVPLQDLLEPSTGL